MANNGPQGPPTVQYRILHEYGFAPFEETVYEEWELEDNNLVERFARADHLLSCYFLVDPDLMF